MRILSTRFKTIERLEAFIKTNVVGSNKKIFVQILADQKSDHFFKKINNILQKYVLKENIFALVNESIILNGLLVKDIVINFFLINHDDGELVYCKNFHNCKDLDKDTVYFLYATDLDKKNFLKNVADDIILVGSFYHDRIYHKETFFDTGALLFKIKKSFDIDIEIVNTLEPIGRELKVEKCQEGYIKTIENLSPKELYKHYLSDELSGDLKVASYSFPLMKKSKNRYESSLILDDALNSVKLEYCTDSGDFLRLGFANSSAFYKKYQNSIEVFDKKPSDCFIVISSFAREAFFEQNGFEFEHAVGHFSKSEVVIYGSKKYDLTHSVIMININSKNSEILKNKRFKPLKISHDSLIELDALANIARVSSNELEELNKKLELKVKKEVEKNLKKDSILIHRSRLAQMGEMMSLIAHQWKQPLSAISATSSGLHIKIELDMYDKEFFLKSLTKIEEFVNHLSSTIDDFSNFFKPSKVKQSFYIYEAINKALSIATYSLSKKSIDLELDLDESLKVETYQNELIQVLLNIIKNAENILIKREIENPRIKIKLFQKKNKKIIEISDNGGGIDQKIISKIFEPYFSTKAAKDSTGLGLYMSKFIVEDSLGGEISVRNSSVGAVFSIILV